MAFKLTKKEHDTLSEFARTVRAKADTVREALDDYNRTLDDVENFRQEIHDRLQGEYDDKSEKWQEGEKAQAASDMISQWDKAIEQLDDLELDHADTLEGLPLFADQ